MIGAEAGSCENSALAPVFEFDPNGTLLKNFGATFLIFPHGIYVDQHENVWRTDGKASNGKGLQVFRFSPDGKILLTLGKPAAYRDETEDTFDSPTDVAVAADGDVFVSDGHRGCNCPNSRIVKFSRDGKFIKVIGKKGSAPE